ncbi:MAG: hypothetical protein CL908_02430 [Deltaproteobacteria bacterium]|nr:hypothetical protein [Deltaproteobacteria bacterium]
MTNRRSDAIYFLVLLVVALIGHQLSRGVSGDAERPSDPAFGPAQLVLPETAIDLPEPFWVFHRSPKRMAPAVPGSASADPVESALSKVRTELLSGPAVDEVRAPDRLAAVLE